MTPEKLNEMVAVHLMGYSVPVTCYPWSDRIQKKYPIRRYLKHDRETAGEYGNQDYHPRALEDGSKNSSLYGADNYCRDMLDAWKVVERMEKLTCDFSLERSGKRWTATFAGVSKSGPDAETAICNAALSFVGQSTEEA